ncbi:putative 2-aminoethylphosphonate ABC transporter substrate-binding protein [uncultured Clostridium sp.]|uniref:putative 2-aminoethylphosphonate ABC transporter substrate-binding protein n=1 Tax=uncultured Clostridium sp. TaxID=59620 RepID=UPI00261718AD|nr:putative 2-aminoethylphosphonate ABC transporter substrate-binding protein [uncultured Clostridium sp.]
MKKILGIILTVLVSSNLFVGCISNTATSSGEGLKKDKKELTIYTALEEEQVTEYIKAFETKFPEIDVNLIMDSHGIISAKVLSEKENPQADVIWGLSAINMIGLDKQGLLEPYKPENFSEINKMFMGDIENPSWIGLTVTETAFVVNNKELDKLGLEVPKSYKDLLKPEYKGLITMSNPASSGTGYFTVSAILQLMGEEEGFKYLEDLHANIGIYTHSGSKPSKLAASGEYPIGISFGYRGIKQKEGGDPVEVIFPTEGSGWDLESLALNKKDKISEEAKIFMKWALSDEAMKLYSKNAAITSIDTGIAAPKGYPENPLEQLIENDLNWASDNRERVLKTWEENYAKKTEAK